MRRSVSPDSPRQSSRLYAVAISASAYLEEERDRWILWIPVGLGAGIGAYFALSLKPPWWSGPVAACLLIAAAVWLRARPAPFLALLFVLVPAIGFASAQLRAAWVAAPTIQQRLGPTGVGRVVTVEIRQSGRRVTIDRLRISRLGPDRTPERIRLRVPAGAPQLTPGDWLRARAILMTPPPPAAPGAYDFQRRAYFETLGGVGFSLGAPERIAEGGATGLAALPEFVATLRQNISAHVRAALPGVEGAVAAALMTGDRGTIPRPVLDDLRDSGLAHLLAISGLHIGLVAALLFGGVRLILALIPGVALRSPIKKWAAAVAVVGAFLYALIAGATIPTQRAFLMIGLILVAVMLDRRGLSMRVVAWAATVVLLIRPESLLGASFQLSFAAVVALVAVYEKVYLGRWLQTSEVASPYRKSVRYLAGVGLTTIVGRRGDGAIRRLSLQPVRRLRPGGKLGCRSSDSPVDHAVGHGCVRGVAPGPRVLGSCAHGPRKSRWSLALPGRWPVGPAPSPWCPPCPPPAWCWWAWADCGCACGKPAGGVGARRCWFAGSCCRPCSGRPTC